MSTKDFIKKSVLNAFTQYDAPKLAVALLAALALGILIYLVYRKFYTGVVYSRSFAVTLVGMCVLTCMVTLAISTNVVISLGMVGALSIVRFRTAVKDPLDLLYLFWSITTGITTGAGANRFAPDATVTRGQFVTFLYRLANASSDGVHPFTDVPAGSYYEKAIAWAYAEGITKGTGATTFSPDAPCTRAQIITFLYRYFNR